MSPDGQRNAIYARQEAALWEIVNTMYDALDPDKAEGDQFADRRCASSRARFRKRRRPTIVACDCTLVFGTVLASDGTVAASVAGKPDVLFFPRPNADGTDYTARIYRTTLRQVPRRGAGPLQVNAGTLTTIATPVTGWSSVTNPLDGKLGLAATRKRRCATARGSRSPRPARPPCRAFKRTSRPRKTRTRNLLLTSVTVNENSTDARRDRTPPA
jgi:hypothetical protein